MTDDCLLGIDVGTSGTKALLTDASGSVLGVSSVEYPMDTPQPGWAEQDPAVWLAATKRAIRTLMTHYGEDKHVVSIGLTGQMHGLVLLNKDRAVLRPSILWCDQRTTAQCQTITSRVGGRSKLIALTCNPALEGFTAPKLLWVREHEPEVYRQIDRVLLPKDYVRWGMTGTYATEVSDASGTLWFDVRNRRWSNEMLAALDVPLAWMPPASESPVVTAYLSAASAADLGLRADTPIVGGGGDQAAGAVGTGIVRSGLVSSTIGTSGVVFAHSDAIKLDPHGRLHTFCHAVPGAWHLMGVTQGAGLSLRWFRDNFAVTEVAAAARAGLDPYELLMREAERASPGSDGLLWLPYLMGERTPHLDANARGVLFGLTARHTRFDVIRAILEGVTFSLRDSLEILRELDVPVDHVRASGGGARSALWRQLQADIFGTTVSTVNALEGPAFGAALLAGVGAEVFPSVEAACAATIAEQATMSPRAQSSASYGRLYSVYRGLYGALKPQFDALATFSQSPAQGNAP
jgi:xylulokinase